MRSSNRSIFAILHRSTQHSALRTQHSGLRTQHSALLFLNQRVVGFRPPVAEELPNVTHFANLIQVQIGDDELIRITRCLCDYLAARVAKIALTVELAYVP